MCQKKGKRTFLELLRKSHAKLQTLNFLFCQILMLTRESCFISMSAGHFRLFHERWHAHKFSRLCTVCRIRKNEFKFFCRPKRHAWEPFNLGFFIKSQMYKNHKIFHEALTILNPLTFLIFFIQNTQKGYFCKNHLLVKTSSICLIQTFYL